LEEEQFCLNPNLKHGNYGNQSFTYSGTFAYTSYTGNRVNTILNNGNAYRTYSYDQNGNALTAGTFGYDYNMLDLPNDVKLNGSVFNTYTYDAVGKKLRKVSTASGYSTDYIDGIQYKNGVIDFIATEEGRFENSGSPLYQYDLKGPSRKCAGYDPEKHRVNSNSHTRKRILRLRTECSPE